MSRCSAEHTVRDAESALARARRETLARGGTFEGDTSRGRYLLRTPLGVIEGTYTGEGDRLRVVVDKKPALVPCALISRTLAEFFRAERGEP